MAQTDNLEVRIDNAQVMFRNFAGIAKKFNQPGDRNFCIFLSDEVAKKLAKDGWNIRWLTSRSEEPPQAMLAVKVNFGNRPPNIVVVSDGKMTKLTEATIKELDFAEFKQVDLILRGYKWDVSGQKGVKAYLKSGYFVLVVDELAKKYSTTSDSDQEEVVEYAIE